jgi:hypothetical protein
VRLLCVSLRGSVCAHRHGGRVVRKREFGFLCYLIPIKLLRGLKEVEETQGNQYSFQELEENIPREIGNIFR